MITVEEAKRLVENGRLKRMIRHYSLNNNRRFAGETKSVIKAIDYETMRFIRDCFSEQSTARYALNKLLTYYPEQKIKNTTPIQGLINLLTEQTQTLKEQYILKVEDYAFNEFDRLMVYLDWKHAQWVEKFPKNIIRNGELVDVELSKEGYSFRNKVYTANRIGKEKFIATEKKNAILHYESSIVKLAYRISDKKLDLEKINVTSTHIGVNIETLITDGTQTVHAYTIIASGEIQRPHYRYLIK